MRLQALEARLFWVGDDWRDIFRRRVDGCTFDDLAEVVRLANGEANGADWLGVFRLNDGRYVAVSASLDYADNARIEGGVSRIADTYEEAIAVLNDQEMRRLGIRRTA